MTFRRRLATGALAAWSLVLGVFAVVKWPRAEAVSEFDVFPKMKLSSIQEVGTVEGMVPQLPADADPEIRRRRRAHATLDEQIKNLTVDIDGHVLQFATIDYAEMKSSAQVGALVNAVCDDYRTALHDVLDEKRRAFAAWIALWWVAPPLIVAAAGWTLQRTWASVVK